LAGKCFRLGWGSAPAATNQTGRQSISTFSLSSMTLPKPCPLRRPRVLPPGWPSIGRTKNTFGLCRRRAPPAAKLGRSRPLRKAVDAWVSQLLLEFPGQRIAVALEQKRGALQCADRQSARRMPSCPTGGFRAGCATSQIRRRKSECAQTTRALQRLVAAAKSPRAMPASDSELLFRRLIMMWAPAVPGCISHGALSLGLDAGPERPRYADFGAKWFRAQAQARPPLVFGLAIGGSQAPQARSHLTPSPPIRIATPKSGRCARPSRPAPEPPAQPLRQARPLRPRKWAGPPPGCRTTAIPHNGSAQMPRPSR